MLTPILILVYLGLSALLIYLCHRIKWMNRLGAILWAYGLGLVIGNISILPAESEKVLNTISEITVPLAIPLLLFSLSFTSWIRMAGKTLLSLLIALFSVILVVSAGFFLFRNHLADPDKIAGMLVGVYTGGTPNMAALKTALEVDNNVFILTHTYDMAIGAVFLFFLLSVAQRVLHYFLPPFKKSAPVEKAMQYVTNPEFDSFSGFFKKKNLWPSMAALGLSILIFAVAFGAMQLVPEKSQTVVVILVITTLGILLSLVPRINRIEKSFQLGMYLVVVFSMAVASMANIEKILSVTPHLFLYVALAYFGTLTLHVLISRLFKIDADTTIITMTGLLYSPPFVPAVAAALKNKEVILGGITVGLLGYAAGNYLGVTLAYLLGNL